MTANNDIDAIASKAQKQRPMQRSLQHVPPPAEGLEFSAGHFLGLNYKQALHILADPEKSFEGHKQVLFAGICTWLLTPAHDRNVADAMISETFRLYAQAEQRVLQDMQLQSLLETPTRILVENRGLMERIYYYVGGASAIRSAYDRAHDRQQQIEQAKLRLSFMVAIASLLHWHAVNERSIATFGKRSYVHAGNLVGKLQLAKPAKGNTLATRALNEYWKLHHPALPLTYAANLCIIDSKTTLLDKIAGYADGNAVLLYADVKPHLSRWFEYNNYLLEHVFKGVPLSDREVKKFPTSGNASLRPEDPQFKDSELSAIEAEFSKAKSRSAGRISRSI